MTLLTVLARKVLAGEQVTDVWGCFCLEDVLNTWFIDI